MQDAQNLLLPRYQIMTLAPIILFVYNRPDHTARTLQALRQNPEAVSSDLHIYADGPKTTLDAEKVAQVRGLLADLAGFKSTHVSVSKSNLGLANSIIRGVTEVIDNYGTAIVLEDDIVVSKFFLQFMNKALAKYAQDTRVASIHGWNFPLKDRKIPDSFFLRGADCWGWATWKRAWDLFEPDGTKLLKQLEEQNLTERFDLDGAYPYMQMLKEQIAGKNNSWAVRWHASMYLRNMLTLHPGRSLVVNIGLDGSGVHSHPDESLLTVLPETPPQSLPQIVEEDSIVRSTIIKYLKKTQQGGRFKRLAGRLKHLLRARLRIDY